MYTLNYNEHYLCIAYNIHIILQINKKNIVRKNIDLQKSKHTTMNRIGTNIKSFILFAKYTTLTAVNVWYLR